MTRPAGVRLTWPDAFYVTYDHLVTGEMKAIREAEATSGIGVLARFDYDDQGRRTLLTLGNGTSTAYAYDPVSRLSRLTLDIGGTASDLTLGFGYNPAGQIVSNTRSNDAYSWTGAVPGTTQTSADGLNRIAGWTAPLTYDGRGNITGDGAHTYAFSSENRLTSARVPSGVFKSPGTYAYDPLGRLSVATLETNAAYPTTFAYDNGEIVFHKNPYPRARRFIQGPWADETLVVYIVYPSSIPRFWVHGDERGSTVALSLDSGAADGSPSRYDEYGVSVTGNESRYSYTGQRKLPGTDLYHYKARVFDPRLEWFLQTMSGDVGGRSGR